MINAYLVIISLFTWIIFVLKKLMFLNTMLERDGELNRITLKQILFQIWLTGLLAYGTLALIGLGPFYGSTYIFFQRILGLGVLFPSVSVVVGYVLALRYEREHKQKHQQSLSGDINQEV